MKQRKEELAQRIMDDVNQGINARFDRFELALERLSANPAPAPRQISPARPAVARSKKRLAGTSPSNDPPA